MRFYRLICTSVVLAFFTIPSISAATSISNGTLNFSYNGDGSIQNESTHEYFGWLQQQAVTGISSAENAYLNTDIAPAYGSLNAFGSSIDGTVNFQQKQLAFNASVTNLPDNNYTSGRIYLEYFGTYQGTLDDFMYDYTFSSSQSFSEGYLYYYAKVEIGYTGNSSLIPVYSEKLDGKAGDLGDNLFDSDSIDLSEYGQRLWQIHLQLGTTIRNAHIDLTPPGEPVPEPATMLLFGAGISALAGSRFRKKGK